MVLNCLKGNKNVLCKNAITDFNKKLVVAIDMKAFGEPLVYHFGEANKKGFTSVQLIETSNITGHFCDDTRDFYLDVFSCKDYDEQKVVNMIYSVFEPVKINYRVLLRDAPTFKKYKDDIEMK